LFWLAAVVGLAIGISPALGNNALNGPAASALMIGIAIWGAVELHAAMAERDERSQAAYSLRAGERIRIMSGTFKHCEAEVGSVDPASGKITAFIFVGFTAQMTELPGGTKWERITEGPAR